MDAQGLSAADRHQNQTPAEKGYVKWKDVITGLGHGPDPVLVWVRGSVCVFPQDQQDPVWIPGRLKRRCNKQDEASNHVPVDDDDPDTDSGQ